MTEQILPHELPTALERGPETVLVLSLDCFDTLLWRDCFAPGDVFSGLSSLTTGQRIVAEQRARKAKGALRGSSEIGLNSVYEHALPNGSETQHRAAVEEEIALEARVCFAFEPTVELMRAAKESGLKIIIVSDTYLTSQQLLALITRAAGEEVAGLIDRVFASCDAEISKSQGLLAKVLKSIKCRPDEILHIGDNQKADYDSARALGIPALHLAQFSEAARHRLRFERSCQQLIGEAAHDVCGLMPHRAILAKDEPQVQDAAEALGLSVLGPVFYTFDQWLHAEAETLAKAERAKKSGGDPSGKVHWLFMLRDGHLPELVHQAGLANARASSTSTARAEISRFTAIAASLTTRGAYQKQWTGEFGLNPSTLARQMLMEEEEIARVVGDPQTEPEMIDACNRLRTEVRGGAREKLTRRRARGRADRLIAHVRSAVDPQPGDTLMLVDLGYNGSAQDRVDSILADAFDVHVAGRYLLLREMAASGLDKKGLIDDRHFDPEMLEALCGNVAVIEQLATCELGSVTDYTEDGAPIRKKSAVKGAQSDVRDRVQAGVTRFARAASKRPIIRSHNCTESQDENTNEARAWREGAAAALTRFMFLPHERELAVLKSFEHDVNLGSERMVALFDENHARAAMRRRGLFYMKGSARMFLPAELAREDINTRLSLLVQKRFGLGLSYSDSAAQTITIPAFYLSADGATSAVVDAAPTHEGFYTARLPLASGVQGIALQVGSVFEWFEISSITSCAIDNLKGGSGSDMAVREVLAQFDGLTDHAGGLLECTDPAAFVLVNPPRRRDESGPQMIEITLRPLRIRKGVQAGAVTQNAIQEPAKFPAQKPTPKDAAA